MRRVTALLAVTLAGVGVVSATTPAAAKRTPPKAAAASIKTSPYVALGDSYSSAAGVMPQVLDSPPTCSRSQINYAHDIAAKTNPASFADVTCSGATTGDFYTSQAPGVAPQLDAVNKSTRLVTMTIGGNDEGIFVDSFFGCIGTDAGQIYGHPCETKYGNTFVNEIKTQTYANLVRALSAVRAKAPHATVVILGYPRILPNVGELSCYPAIPISLGDVPWLVNQELVLNNVVRQAAAVTGARYVDTFTPSAGHDACQPIGTRWLEPVIAPINAYPVHPNSVGEAHMAQETLAAIGR
ncbi:MAG: SGNH/GDSL hydrolase family protein [Pseudonocardiales bacterium]